MNHDNVQVQKISILPPQQGLEFPWWGGGGGGGGFSKTKKFKEMCEALLEFPEGLGGGGCLRKNPIPGGGMDIFWNYTISLS